MSEERGGKKDGGDVELVNMRVTPTVGNINEGFGESEATSTVNSSEQQTVDSASSQQVS